MRRILDQAVVVVVEVVVAEAVVLVVVAVAEDVVLVVTLWRISDQG